MMAFPLRYLSLLVVWDSLHNYKQKKLIHQHIECVVQQNYVEMEEKSSH